MKKVKLISLLLLLNTLLPVLSAQEFNCLINISSQKIEGTDKRVFESLQKAMFEFMNNRKWSNYNFKVEERIECSFLLTVNSMPGPDEFTGTLNVVLRRPVLNSAYNSVLINYIDKAIQFRYMEFQPLDYSDGTFTSNLTSIMAYYAYTMLGYYFDSYSPKGGSEYFEKAQEVVNAAQNTPESGWKAFESEKNRWWIVGGYLNPANSGLRDFSYKYHHMGLDMMYEKVDQGRASITDGLEILKKVYEAKPNLYILQMVFDAKRDELVNIYSDQRVPPMEKSNAVNILKDIDPANSSKYQTILDSK